jgi:hypothetical protein
MTFAGTLRRIHSLIISLLSYTKRAQSVLENVHHQDTNTQPLEPSIQFLYVRPFRLFFISWPLSSPDPH